MHTLATIDSLGWVKPTYISKRCKRQEKDSRKRATSEQQRRLDRLQKLISHWWRPEDCIRTSHAIWRSDQRNITWSEFAAAWHWGDWTFDEDAPEYFIARWDRCKIVITFCEETPILVTAVHVADHLAA